MPDSPLPADGNSLDLNGRSAVVTGSSSGIGRAIALELAAAGADVLVHARQSEEAAGQVAEQIESLGRRSGVVLADLADPDAQDRLVEQADAWSDSNFSIWINNAGVDVLTGAAADLTFEEKLAALWQVDIVATMRLSRAAGQRMKHRGTGALLNTGWDQAEIGMGGDSGEMFGTIKGGIMAFTRSLAKSLAPEVRVNCLAPGWIRTSWGEDASTYWQDRATAESLVGRWGEPEDVARVARFLVSDAASFVNGQIVPINGGLGKL